MAKRANFDVRESFMSAARRSVEKSGFNAMSFRDLAEEVGVKAATLHYHFPTKADLAEALVVRYREDVLKILEPLNDLPYEDAIAGYVGLFRSFFEGSNRMCMGGMMSAEVSALSEATCQQIDRFMSAHIDWIAETLARKHPRMPADKRHARAKAIFASLEGAQLITRGLGSDPAVFDGIVDAYRASGLI
ncbi:TetR family transcriptional regulator [Nostoc sp. 3335mG]|nr:TetR family transcriptional regulator [Nostoc sp. 3335mG]